MLCRRKRKWRVRTLVKSRNQRPREYSTRFWGKFHSSPVEASCASQPTSQPRTIVDIITRLIKHYNCKSTEICHGRLRHCGCPRQTRLFHSLSLFVCSRNTRCCNSWPRRLSRMESEESKKDVEEFRMYGVSILETLTRSRSKLMHQVWDTPWWRACVEIKIRITKLSSALSYKEL